MVTTESLDEEINWNHAIYMLGKLTDVVIILVRGEGDARSRLREATPRLLRVNPDMLPTNSDIQKRVKRAYTIMTKFHDPGEFARLPHNSPETIFDCTLRRIKNGTAAEAAGELFGAWMDLSALVDQHFNDLQNQSKDRIFR